MNLLLSCIGRRGYIARYFKACLGEQDRIFGSSNTPWTPGLASCDEAVLMPPYRDAAYQSAVIEFCRRKEITAILSLMDEDVCVLSSFAGELREVGTIPVMPHHRIANLCLDKWETFKFFDDRGFAMARTFIDVDEALEAIERNILEFPLVVKPRFGFGSANTWQARRPDELRVFFNYQPDMLIQQYIGGEAHNIDLLADFAGRALAIVPWKKVRILCGETEQAITVEAPELIELGLKVLEALDGHIGPMDIDLIVHDRATYILDMNPRFGGGYPTTELAGGNFPNLIVKMLRGEAISPRIGDYKRGVVMMKDIRPFGDAQEAFFREQLNL